MAFSMSQNDINNYINQRKQEDYIKQKKEKQKEQELYQDFLKAYNQFTNMICYQLENNENNWQEKIGEFYKYNLYNNPEAHKFEVNIYASSHMIDDDINDDEQLECCFSIKYNNYNIITCCDLYSAVYSQKAYFAYMNSINHNIDLYLSIRTLIYETLKPIFIRNNMNISPLYKGSAYFGNYFEIYY